MSTQIQRFNNTIPAGTLASAPLTFQMQLGTFQVDRIVYRVPRGCNGSVGFYIASSNQQIVPYVVGNNTTWIVENDTTQSFNLTDQPTTGDFQMVGYNVGSNPHTISVTFELTPVGLTDPAAVTGLGSLAVLNS